MKNHSIVGGLGGGSKHQNGTGLSSSRKIGLAAALDDSDDHDDFNPINDLMPPSITGEDMDLIGKKRPRDKDPLRRLVDETSIDEPNQQALGAKRQKTV